MELVTERLIREFEDGSRLMFDRGRIDLWRVKMVDADGGIGIPRDVDIFEHMKEYEDPYDIMVAMWRIAEGVEAHNILADIEMPEVRGGLREEKLFWTAAALFRAEDERKFGGRKSLIGRRIKLLGMYQATILGWDSEIAARWSRGKKVRRILDEYKRLFRAWASSFGP